MRKLISYAEFARLANIRSSTIAVIAKTILRHAVYEGRMDLNTDCALNYLKSRTLKARRRQSNSKDPLYDKCLQICQEHQMFTITFVRKFFGVTIVRAEQLINLMLQNNEVPLFDKVDKILIPGIDSELTRDLTPSICAHKSKKNKIIEDIEKKIDESEAVFIENIDKEMVEVQKNDEKVELSEDIKNEIALSERDDLYEELNGDVRKVAHLSLNEIVDKYGTITGFTDVLKASKLLQDLHEKKRKNAQADNELVSRELVKRDIFQPIDFLFNRLLTDGSKTIAKSVGNMVKSGSSPKECELFVSEKLGSFIKPFKKKTMNSSKYV